MRKVLFILVILSILISINSNLSISQNLTGREIMIKNDQQRKADDQSLELTMKLINKKGKERIRKVQQVTKTDRENNEKSLIRFLSPADVKGTGLLTIEHTNRDDDQWLYLPALKKVRRISSNDRSDNFMGSDFAYEDISPEELEHYDYKFLKSEDVDNITCFLIEAIPITEKEKNESGYSRRQIWIGQDDFITRKINFYDKKGELFKVFFSRDVRLIKDTNKKRAHYMEVENIKTNHKTVLIYDNYQINKGLSDNIFTQRQLKKGR